MAARSGTAVKAHPQPQASLALYSKHSPDLKLLLPSDTTFASLSSSFILQHSPPLSAQVINIAWDDWVDGTKKVQIEARAAGHHQLKAVLRLADASSRLHRGVPPAHGGLQHVPASTGVCYRMFSLGACWRQQGSTPHHSAIEDIFNDRWEYMGTSTPQGYALDLSSSLGHDFPPSAR
jgi:hypothetical protein